MKNILMLQAYPASSAYLTSATPFLRVCSGGMLAGVLTSFPLWWFPRMFPVIQLLDNFSLSNRMNNGFFILMLLGLVWQLIKPSQYSIASLLFGLMILIAADLLRFQPWVYFYGLLLLAYVISPARAWFSWRLVISSTYLWAGLHKFTGAYLITSIGMLKLTFNWLPMPFIIIVSAVVPALELVVGLGLWFPNYHSRVRVLAYFLHGSILLLLICIDLNRVVWPWNLAIPALLYYLPSAPERDEADVFLVNRWPYVFFFFLFMLLPALSPTGVITRSMAWHLYSEDSYTVWLTKNGNRINLNTLCEDELLVPLPSEERVLNQLLKMKCQRYPGYQLVLKWHPDLNRVDVVVPCPYSLK